MSRVVAYNVLIQQLAERQWRRMTRSITPYGALNERDRAACRALVEPVVRDLIDLAAMRVTNTGSNGTADLAHVTIDLTAARKEKP